LVFWKPKVYKADGSDYSAGIPSNMFEGRTHAHTHPQTVPWL